MGILSVNLGEQIAPLILANPQGNVADASPQGQQVIDHNISVMALSFVGKFMGVRPNIDVVRSFIKRRWHLKLQTEITAMAKVFFSFTFSCEEDLSDVLCGGPWVIGKTSLDLKCWSPNLDLNDGIFCSAPVWVRLPSFPLKFWHEDVFKGLASSFWELLSVDSMMAARKRIVYVPICVCVNQNTDLPSSVDIISKLGKLTQQVELETMSFVCFNCKKSGHWTKNYPLQIDKVVAPSKINFGLKNGPHEKTWREKTSKVVHNEDGSIETVKDIANQGDLKGFDSSGPVQLEEDGDIDVIKMKSEVQ
ncbi:uncharacterized protein LOC131075066 [Cryptomeria japonica]|uniref:uncharacterized protein LOC131075066 n=1 Tax=Cryptomeria japonica TaxID=3369 RepID=UPI0027DA639A|nr:uncharacterized protein LOC131075066 [Cryptomeria japonica]